MQKRPIKIHHLNHLMHRHRRRVIAVLITCLGLLGLFILSIVFVPTKQFSEEPSFENPPAIPIGSQSNTVTPPEKVEPTLPVQQEQVQVERGDSLSTIFDKMHVSPQQLIAVADLPLVKKAIRSLHPGQVLGFVIDDKNNLQRLSIPINRTQNIVVTRDENGFSATTVTQEVNIATKFAAANITSSFYAAGDAANIPQRIMANFAKIFSWKINFKRDVHKGDHFSVLYQLVKNLKTQKTEPGDIIAASYTHSGITTYAFQYRDNYGRINYYDALGRSLRKAFLRRPITGGYISSPFSLHRMDPILKKVRPHTGTDFAAPYGTPIHATGDGRIILQGRVRGYGRCVIINNGHGITTLFAHMSRYDNKYKNGSYVREGDVIGYIGTSGWSTGPHVHYEYRINHHYENPMTVKLPNAAPVPINEREAYKAYVKDEKQKLHSA